jgi:oxygen-independent coproporphyrinogen-3 oxidase
LIYGLPDQTIEDWASTVEMALEFGSEHLSLYGLQVEERTVLAKEIGLGRVARPDSDRTAEMYELAVDRLSTAGLTHYEISNWAKPGFESRHNLTYWLNRPYLGFGAGVHSYSEGIRYENIRNPREYIRRLEAGEPVVAVRHAVDPEREMAETVILGLRLERGIAFEEFASRFDREATEVYSEQIAQLVDYGVLEVDQERMWLNERGRLVSNEILWRFLPA